MEKTIFQANITRIIIIYVFLGILATYCSIIAYKVLVRKRQRLNLITSGFYISLSIGFFLNMIYAIIPNHTIVVIFHFLTVFFLFFSAVFLLIANMVILESSLIYSVKRQNRYILYYGIILFAGMLLLIILGSNLDQEGTPFYGVQLIPYNGVYIPQWGPIFFAYMVSVMSIFTLIPINYTNFKIYFRFETKALKRKWFFYLFGFLGLTAVLYLSSIYNLLKPENPIRFIITLLLSSVIIWGYMMYYGIGIELKK